MERIERKVARLLGLDAGDVVGAHVVGFTEGRVHCQVTFAWGRSIRREFTTEEWDAADFVATAPESYSGSDFRVEFRVDPFDAWAPPLPRADEPCGGC